ncbi:MAG TPA: glycosyltransferase family 39 protein [Candidatus Saccharimonadales bacterium]|nr:glycosyltransferase family 39 protein [Candidatus Saccharimonadales bacterium]
MNKGLKRWLASAEPLSFLAYAVGIVVLFVLYIWRLGSLVPGLSSNEVAARDVSSGIHKIYHQPLYAPHSLVQHLFTTFSPHSPFYLRFTSVIFALVMIFCFYKLAVMLFGKLIGSAGALIFAATPFLVVSGRQATAAIMLFSPVVLMLIYNWLVKSQGHKNLAWLLLIISSAILVYVPGLFWFVIAGFIICRQRLISAIAEVPRRVTGIGFILGGLILVPLILRIVSHWTIVKGILLIPTNWEGAVHFIKNIAWMFLSLFVHASHQNDLIVGQLALLSIVQTALLVFGAYALWGAAKSKFYLLWLNIIFAVVAAAANNNLVYLALGLPAAGIFVTAGLRYLYIEWRAIFPVNPLPKTVAILLIGVVLAIQTIYGLRYSVTAWPQTIGTRNAYVLK